jgi:hypothetical protein
MLKKQSLRIILLFVGLFSVLFIWKGELEFIDKLTREDGFVESLTALFYFIGLVFCCIAIAKRKKKFFPIVWAFLCFVFLGEETSWFQRVFDYSVEAVENVNEQGEFNLHNLEIFDGEELFIDGKLNNKNILNILSSTQNIFRLGFFGYFLVLPLLLFLDKIKNLLSKIDYKKPSVQFRLIMLVVFGFAFILSVYTPYIRKMAIAETREMLYAFFILFYVVFYIWYDKKNTLAI